MKKYRKKPIVIEATQLEHSDFVGIHPNKNHVPDVTYNNAHIQAVIVTLEGAMVGKPGDWIIKGIQGGTLFLQTRYI